MNNLCIICGYKLEKILILHLNVKNVLFIFHILKQISVRQWKE